MASPSSPSPLTMNGRDWGTLLFLSLLWGGSFFFVGIAVKGLPPFTIVALRVVIASTTLCLVLWARGMPLPFERRTLGLFLTMGLLNNVLPQTLIVWAQTHITSGAASILNATTPLFTVLIAHAFTQDERLTPAKLAGIGIGFGGVAAMMGPDAVAGLGSDLLAQGAILIATLSYGVAGVYGRRFVRYQLPPLTAAAGALMGASLLLIPLSLVFETPWALPPATTEVWGAVLGLALLSTALAYALFYRLLGRAGASNLSLVTFLIPVSAILLGAGILGETLESRHLVGMALISCGLAALDGRPLRWLKPAPAPNG